MSWEWLMFAWVPLLLGFAAGRRYERHEQKKRRLTLEVPARVHKFVGKGPRR